MATINYDLSRIRGIAFDVDGVLSPSTIPLAADGQPARMVNIKDGYAMQLAVKCGLHIAIITGGNSEAVRVRFQKLGVPDVVMGAGLKLPVFDKWMEKRGLTAAEVAFVGDDIPDLPVMRRAGLSVAPSDAAAEVREAATYVSPCQGGYGVGRDVLEQVMRAQGTWMNDLHAFGW